MEEVPDRPSPVSSGHAVIALLLLFVLAAFTVWNVVRPTPQAEGRTKWEYQIIAVPDEQIVETLNKLGAQGWEVVAARRAVSSSERTAAYELILKRSRADNYLISE